MINKTALLSVLLSLVSFSDFASASAFLDFCSETKKTWGPYFWEKPEYTRNRCKNVSPEECKELQMQAVKDGVMRESELPFLQIYNVWIAYDGANKIKKVCPCGCFKKGTKISLAEPTKRSLFDKLSVTEKSVDKLKSTDNVKALVGNWTSTPKFGKFGIKSPGVISGPEEYPLVVIRTQRGKEIALTRGHGVPLADGRMIEAAKVELGNDLVLENGDHDQVISVESEVTQELVWNFHVDSERKESHIIVANGFLMGDLAWQNEYADELGKVLLRR